MKVLLTHRFFWPDTAPYALMLRSIGEALDDAGHDVHIFASVPSYRTAKTVPRSERLGGLDVRRVWVFRENRKLPALRALNALIYCFSLFLRVLRLRPDVVTASSFPPVLASWFGSLAARLIGARFIYHVQDIHPEVSQIIGGGMGKWPFAAIMRWLDNQTLRRSDMIVVLSEDMAETLRRRGLGDLPVRIVNNFLLDDFEDLQPPPTELVKAPGTKRLIFAGNLGRFQNLEGLTDGIALCLHRHPELELFFLGDGAVADALKRNWAEHQQVSFGPFLPFSQAKGLIADADIGLVSLVPGMCGVAYPSKMMTYLGLGVPVFVLTDAESALSKNLQDGGLGQVSDGYAAEEIARSLERLLSSPPSRDKILACYETSASRTNATRLWCEAMLEVGGDSR